MHRYGSYLGVNLLGGLDHLQTGFVPIVEIQMSVVLLVAVIGFIRYRWLRPTTSTRICTFSLVVHGHRRVRGRRCVAP